MCVLILFSSLFVYRSVPIAVPLHCNTVIATAFVIMCFYMSHPNKRHLLGSYSHFYILL